MADVHVQPTAVLNLVGLTTRDLAHAPRLRAFADAGRLRRHVPVLPAVTCSVQASMLTGRSVRDHGIVGNGWLDPDFSEVVFWKQSNRLVAGEKVWETARRRAPGLTTSVMFWWFNMYSSAETSVTPRPVYMADGRKLPDIASEPPELREALQRDLGPFPLFRFWGPGADIASSRWIAQASMRVWEQQRPSLQFVYLPHLDYDHQRCGPDSERGRAAVAALDELFGDLHAFYAERGVRLIVLSEYGLEAVDRPVAINRALREDGWIRVRDEGPAGERLDAAGSRAVAIADHQVAHVYVPDAADLSAVAERLRRLDGVERVLGTDEKRACAIDHRRAGDLVVVAERGAWFTHDYWLDDAKAPDFARTVDIHRKPGYDPRELFLNPDLAAPKVRIALKVLRKKLGFRMLMDVIATDPMLVRGSHGRVEQPDDERPVVITETRDGGPAGEEMPCTGVRDLVLETVLG